MWGKLYESAASCGKRILSKKADYVSLFDEVGNLDECRSVMRYLISEKNLKSEYGYKTAAYNARELKLKWNRILEAMNGRDEPKVSAENTGGVWL